MSKKGTGEPVQTFCPVVKYWRFGCSEVYIIKGKLNAHLKDACSLKNTDIPPSYLVCCGLQYLQNKPSQDFCYLLKKTLQSSWPCQAFIAKLWLRQWQSPIHIPQQNLGLSLNAYMKSFKITLQLYLDKESPN